MADVSGVRNLSPWAVLAGALLGVAAGLFFGDWTAWLHPVGSLYVMLLEVAVYPYLVCSLIHGLGSMQPSSAFRLLRCGWMFYVGLWVLVLAVLFALASGIPPARVTSLVPPSAADAGPDLLGLLVPANPLAALSQNYVPAVVVFCMIYGVALQQVPHKESLLSILDSIRVASLAFWNTVVRFAPFAVFALFADTAGTMRLRELEDIALYVVLLLAGTGALAFWILPACVAALTPWRTREVLAELRSAFTISAVTTLSVSALPFITAATLKLLERSGVTDKDTGEVVRTNLSVAYPLGQIGNFFVFLFMIFASSFFAMPIRQDALAVLPFITILSCVGSPTSSVDSVAFLAQWLGLPSGTDALYVELMTITRYGQVLASVMGFAVLSFTVSLAYYDKLRISMPRLLGTSVVGVAVLTVVAWSAGAISQAVLQRTNPYLTFTIDPALQRNVDVRFVESFAPSAQPGILTIQQSGVLRVGYDDSIIPFCYRNESGDLVGYDVAFVYQLARDMNARIEFVRFNWTTLVNDLSAGRFDLAIGGIYVTPERLLKVGVSDPYFVSPLAFLTLRDRAEDFRTREQIAQHRNLRVGVFNDPVLISRLEHILPDAEMVVVPSYATPPDFSRIDVALWTLEQASAMAAAHQNLIAVEPADLGAPFLFAYLVRPDAPEFVTFLNYWLRLQQTSGFQDAQQAYWIRRESRSDNTPRWSILRAILGE